MAVRAALQLGLFTPLASGPMTAGDMADALGVKPRRLEALLYQLVLSEFLTVSDGRFANTDMAAYYLVEGSPTYVGAIHGIWTENFNALMQTAQSIRTDTAQNKVDFSRISHEQLGRFIKGLHGSAVATGRSLSKQSQFAEARSLIDVGGGSGGLAIALCQEHPRLQATVLDLPAVIPFAEEMVEEAGLADRITVDTVDIVNDPIEGDFDIAIARALFQVLPADQCGRAAQNIGTGVTRGGTLFVIGFATDDSRLSPTEAVGLNLIFMSMFDGGQAYTESEYRRWLSDAGFAEISREPYLMGNSLITARKT
jgi:ribosomal protein L11 methylase PrmA